MTDTPSTTPGYAGTPLATRLRRARTIIGEGSETLQDLIFYVEQLEQIADHFARFEVGDVVILNRDLTYREDLQQLYGYRAEPHLSKGAVGTITQRTFRSRRTAKPELHAGFCYYFKVDCETHVEDKIDPAHAEHFSPFGALDAHKPVGQYNNYVLPEYQLDPMPEGYDRSIQLCCAGRPATPGCGWTGSLLEVDGKCPGCHAKPHNLSLRVIDSPMHRAVLEAKI